MMDYPGPSTLYEMILPMRLLNECSIDFIKGERCLSVRHDIYDWLSANSILCEVTWRRSHGELTNDPVIRFTSMDAATLFKLTFL